MEAALFITAALGMSAWTSARRTGAEDASAASALASCAKWASQRRDLPPVTHTIMCETAAGKRTPRAPVWAMRQAGRYLPEFRALRHIDFLTRVHTPELAAEITLQPLRHFPDLLDAVVIFSDILIVPPVIGLPVKFAPGPQFGRLLTSPADLATLNFKPNVAKEFKFLFDAITLTRRQMAEHPSGKVVPIIGFVGAPWTLMSYMIDGELAKPTPEAAAAAGVAAAGAAGSEAGAAGSKTPAVERLTSHKSYERSKTWLIKHSSASHQLLSALTDILVELLVQQYQAGADLLQVFETNADQLSPARFEEFAFPYLQRIATEVRKRVPPVSRGGPAIILFAKGAQFALDLLASDTEYDVLSIDWQTVPEHAVDVVRAAAAATGKPAKVLQGNLDPCELFGCEDDIRHATSRMVEGFGTHPFIGNLGHGMLPSHTPEALESYFRAVHEMTRLARAK